MRLMMRFLLAALVSSAWCAGFTQAASASPLLLQNPTISKTQIAFVYGGDIWIVGREGGNAHPLVTGYGLLAGPFFSPDGATVAFSGNYQGHSDVFVVPSSGGEPRRLTYHPSGNLAVGWTHDGNGVLFRSRRASATLLNNLFTVPVANGLPSALPLPSGETGSFSPDGSRIAYVPGFQWEPFWQGYRGGQTTSIYVSNLSDSSTTIVPKVNSNDTTPMWIGTTIYFLSDRNGPVTLFAYDPATKKVARELPSEGFDITSASLGPDAIVYAQFDSLHVFDPRTRATHPVRVNIAGELLAVMPHWVRVGTQIENADISPTGVRAVFEAHGQIFTIPSEHGDIRNVSASPATANRDPAWSPDGRWIAYFSDRSGEYELDLRDQKGLEPPRAIGLGSPSYYYSPTWSPDSKKIAYIDVHVRLRYLDIDHPAPVEVAHGFSGGFDVADFSPAWSPDSKWLTYTNILPNFLHAVYAYSLDEKKSVQVTDGMSDARFPQFDKSGNYLYFIASTNTGLTSQGLDMTSDQHPVSSAVYATVLRKDVASPNELKSDEETVKSEATPDPSATKKPAAAKPAFRIDAAGLDQRTVALPIAEANYIGLFAGKTGEIFLLQAPLATVTPTAPTFTVQKFALSTRRTTTFAAGAGAFALSSNGEKALIAQSGRWSIADTKSPAVPGTGTLDTSGMEVYVNPRAEWRQMYHETWRIERDFFYDPHYHGLDLAAAERRFEPYLNGIGGRADLTFLFQEMLSYLSVGHMFVGGGAFPPVPRVTVGLLGADYHVENGRYRFAKIYNGENWNPGLQAPLTQPGADVHVGDYLLAVNGHALTSAQNIYAAFEETAGKQTILKVGASADGSGSRDVTVVPVGSEAGLRNLDWIEGNRRKVDQLSGGKLAYVYLPDTGFGGFTNFNRYFFAQVGKEGAILDERFNQGGQIADYIIDYLNRTPKSILVPRDGKPILDPPLAIYGPKVMIINQYAGSGGDALPWYFRKANLGPLVGERTWGGLVGIGGYPTLIDGGSVTAPRVAIGGLHGQWEVEGHGIPPDIEVWQDPKLIREGHDPQLEAAVKKAMELLRQHPVPTYHPPPYTDHHPVLPKLGE
jgi:tricorn protease